MSKIRNLITSDLPPVVLDTHSHLVDSVVTRVEQAAAQAAQVLRATAVEHGLDADEVDAVLEQVGLIEPEPEPEPEDEDEDEDEDEAPAWATRLIERFDRIENAARAQGLPF